MIDGCDSPKEVQKPKEGTRCTGEELTDNLSVTGPMLAVLSVAPEHSDVFVPKITLSTFPQPIALLHKSEYITLEYHQLLDVCESVSLAVTSEMAEQVEAQTKSQANSKLWYKYRAGRVTASNMKTVCHTDSTNLSQSLIKRICYPKLFMFNSKQTEWGRKHENLAHRYP